MFDCNNCKNANHCPNKDRVDKEQMVKEFTALEKRFHAFYGRLRLDCDYFIPEKEEIGCCNR